jgi:hypothetical protein
LERWEIPLNFRMRHEPGQPPADSSAPHFYGKPNNNAKATVAYENSTTS